MRSRRTLRRSRPLQIAAGALLVTIATTTIALAAGRADAQGAIEINLSSSHLRLAQHVTVTGSAPATGAGQTVLLEYRRNRSSSWKALKSAKVMSDGHFRFVAAVRNSGLLRVIAAGEASSTSQQETILATSTGSNVAASAPQTFSVGSKFQLGRRSIDVLAGQSARIRGRLLPGVRGRIVRLEGRAARRWTVLGSAHTGRRGGFEIRYRAGGTRGPGGEALRVAFRGDRANRASSGSAGRLVVFRQALASWYSDGGSTACGFHAGLGVANKSLPCGTRVTFRYRGRTVRAVVDDRGPYVGGREWDLNQNTAAALGFGGVGTVWSTS